MFPIHNLTCSKSDESSTFKAKMHLPTLQNQSNPIFFTFWNVQIIKENISAISKFGSVYFWTCIQREREKNLFAKLPHQGHLYKDKEELL